MRRRSIDYDAAARGASYDPRLHWSAPWRDIFGPDGGWRRAHAGGRSEAFDPGGRHLGTALPAAAAYRLHQQGRETILLEDAGPPGSAGDDPSPAPAVSGPAADAP